MKCCYYVFYTSTKKQTRFVYPGPPFLFRILRIYEPFPVVYARWSAFCILQFGTNYCSTRSLQPIIRASHIHIHDLTRDHSSSTHHTAHSTALNLTSRICIAYILQHNTQLQIRPAQTSASATITAQLPVRSSSPTARPGIRPQHGTAHSYLLGITFTALAR